MVLTQQKDTAQYMATMEAAYRSTENQLFYNLQQSNYSRAAVAGYPTDNTTTPNDSLMKLNGSGQKLGAAIILKVMSGDIIDVAVKAYYTTQTGTGTTPSVNDVLNSFANGIVTAASGGKGSLTDLNNTTTSPLFSAINSFATGNNPTIASKPRAYLNWILLDEQLQYVGSYPQSGAVAVGNTATGTLNTLGYTGIPINKNGYLYIYVNNETQGWDVFFDNLSIKHYTGPILSESHYNPCGLDLKAICSNSMGKIENKYKFNGIEKNNDFDLNIYDAFYRNLDPQIGRFWQIDPKPTDWESLYAAMGNNPILNMDPLGDTLVVSGKQKAVEMFKKITDDGLGGFYKTKIDKGGKVTFEATDKQGEMTDEQKAFYKEVNGIVTNTKGTVNVEFATKRKEYIGNVSTTGNLLDIGDIKNHGNGKLQSAQIVLAHELVEQSALQLPPKVSYEGGAHQRGIDAEERITGYRRDEESVGSSGLRSSGGRLSGNIIVPYVNVKSGKVEFVTIILKRGEVKAVVQGAKY
jgi:RHS repeat-associated protein